MDADVVPPPARSSSARTTGILHAQDAMEEDDEEEVDVVAMTTDGGIAPAAPGPAAIAAFSSSAAPDDDDDGGHLLPTSIISPSPYPHHSSGPTSSRFRNALSRVTAHPETDSEAWNALITEASGCHRSLLGRLHDEGFDPDVRAKLDWIESCYGALLHHFPFAASYGVTLVEMLLARSARFGEEDGPLLDPTGDGGVGGGDAESDRCERKVEGIFRNMLGVEMDGTSAPSAAGASDARRGGGAAEGGGGGGEGGEEADDDGQRRVDLGGMCTSSVDLWLLYVRKRSRDATRRSYSLPPDDRPSLIREWTTAAFETAIGRAGFVYNNHLLWKKYLSFVKSWVPLPTTAGLENAGTATDHALAQKQMVQLRSVYQRLVTHPMTGLDQLWQEYEQFERSQSEALAQALIAEFLPKYQHARSVYLERQRITNVHELRMGRLATPPCLPPSSSAEEMAGAGGGPSSAVAGGGAAAGVVPPGATAGTTVEGADPGKVSTLEEYAALLSEETMLLSHWRKKTSYERTNPERLQSASDLAGRVRQSYKDAICGLARYPEVWLEWSTWELHSGAGASSASSAGGSSTSATALASSSSGGSAAALNPHRRNVSAALKVLELAQVHVPDCALLAHAHSQTIELYGVGVVEAGGGKAGKGTLAKPERRCVEVMESFVERSPNTLGFVLLQRLVRRYKGIKAARAVFGRARRALRVKPEDVVFGIDAGDEDDPRAGGAEEEASEKKEDVEGGGGARGEASAAIDEAGLGSGGERRMVTNRLDPAVGFGVAASPSSRRTPPAAASATADGTSAASSSAERDRGRDDGGGPAPDRKNQTKPKAKAGYVTWHLYASHAAVERRINDSPLVAARVYELGLRKHRSFLSVPSYVLGYADLLLELNDRENLRSLLTRSVAAAAAAAASAASSSTEESAAFFDRERVRPLYDAMLRFESTACSGRTDAKAVRLVESRRRRALFGPTVEDVSTGSLGGTDPSGGEVGIGVHKSTLAEQLSRSEGYDVASRIVNAMGRLSEALDVVGIWGDGIGGSPASMGGAATAGGASAWEDDGAAGRSDAAYRGRLRFQKFGGTAFLGGVAGGIAGGGVAPAAAAAAAAGLPVAGSKVATARERYLAQQAAAAAPSATAMAGAAAAAAPSPEWLRPLLSLLPPRYRAGTTSTKPPPHMIEMALTSLRASALPASRPDEEADADGGDGGDGGRGGGNAGSGGVGSLVSPARKRRFDDANVGGGGGDSSDEENGGGFRGDGGGGYGNQFRARQRARQILASSSQRNGGTGEGGAGGSSSGGGGGLSQ